MVLTYCNQALTGAGTSGGGATVKVRTGTGGTITSVEIVDGGVHMVSVRHSQSVVELMV